MLRVVLLALSAYLATGCHAASREPRVAALTEAATAMGAPTVGESGAATYRGIYDEPVKLEAGAWEGQPFVIGGLTRPRLELTREFRLTGDLDGVAGDEAAVILTASSGGSGRNGYLAVVGRKDGLVVNLGTALIGDRVQIRGGRIAAQRIELDVVQTGSGDPACCPGEKATRVWRLDADRLKELDATVTGRLSPADLGGVEWVLTHLARNEPAPDQPIVTLQFTNEGISGSSGCNRYFASVKAAGELPGGIKIGGIGWTRKACPPDAAKLEERYLSRLGGAVKFAFRTGRLAITSRTAGEDATIHTMLFVPRPSTR
jgi:heat shock protein HslJ